MKDYAKPTNAALLARLAKRDYCYVTTTGRVSGRPHEIEIWFALRGTTLYLLSGGGDQSDWVKNMRANPSVTVRLAKHTFCGLARIVSDEQEDKLARQLLAAKYERWHAGQPLSDWAQTALPVAIDIQRKKMSSGKKFGRRALMTGLHPDGAQPDKEK